MSTLASVLPELELAYHALANALAARGIGVGIADYGGFRTEGDTARILQYRQQDYTHDLNAGLISPTLTIQQYRPIAPYGSSWHDYGAAFDLAITARPSIVSSYHALEIAGELAPQFGLRWGGNFRNADPPHFELAIPLRDAAQRYSEASGSLVANVPDLDVGDIAQFPAYLTPSADDPAAGGGVFAPIAAPSSAIRVAIIAAALVVAALVLSSSRRPL